MSVEKITEKIWKIPVDSNSFLVLEKKPFIVDTGRRSNREILKSAISQIIPLEMVQCVIFTHLHYDHIGAFDLFPNATFHASVDEIDCFETDPNGTILDPDIIEIFDKSLSPIPKMEGYKIILCPGHTKGSIALWNKKTGVLFSGDTLFNNGFGRIDLPTSVPDKMESTLAKLRKLPIKHLCPGHEY